MQRCAGLDGDVLDAEIERLGIQFQVASRLTAWIAVDSARTTDGEQAPVETVVPHEIPYGTSIEGFGLRHSLVGTGMLHMVDFPAGGTLRGTSMRRRAGRADKMSLSFDAMLEPMQARRAGKAGPPPDAQPERDTRHEPPAAPGSAPDVPRQAPLDMRDESPVAPEPVPETSRRSVRATRWRRLAWAIVVVLAILAVTILLGGATPLPADVQPEGSIESADRVTERVRP